MRTLRGKKVLVMGLGVSQGGESVTRYLARHGARVTVTDIAHHAQLQSSIKRLKKYTNIKYILGKHRMSDFRSCELIFQNPAVPQTSPYLREARKRGIEITNEAAYFFRHTTAQIIGVTGTRGKSTVSALLYAILKRTMRSNVYLAGNIATRGLLAVLDRAGEEDIVVAELSSWHLSHLSSVKRSPHIAVITNIYPDHLNRYPSYRAYRNDKLQILRFQTPHDFAVLNFDNNFTKGFEKFTKARSYFFSVARKVRGCYLKNDAVFFSDSGRSTRLFSLTGLHDFPILHPANILAATLVAHLLRVKPNTIVSSIREFRGLKYRLQFIGTIGGVRIMNDSASTTPIAAQAALEALSGGITMIAGGDDKKLSYKNLARDIRKRVSDLILLPGSASDKLYAELNRLNFKNVHRVASLDRAVSRALQKSKSSRYLLFSPAATSFNLFQNEFDRGFRFTQAIRNEKKRSKK